MGISGWVYYGNMPFEGFSNVDIGHKIHAFGSSGHVKWGTDFQYEDDGSETLSTGPILYWRFTDLVHGEIEWKQDIYDRQGVIDHGNGQSFKVGIAFVF